MLAVALAAPALLVGQGVPNTIPVIITRVDPATIDDLPPWVREALIKRACLIPQMHSDNLVNNIHSGYLVDSVTESYGLLCSHGGQSSVLVVTRDSTLTPPPILLRSDTSYLIGIRGAGGTRYEFARYLALLKPEEVGSWCPLPAAEKRRVHNGVITFYQDREATAYYFAQTTRQWIRCTVPDPD
jgi:hypothetical protein